MSPRDNRSWMQPCRDTAQIRTGQKGGYTVERYVEWGDGRSYAGTR